MVVGILASFNGLKTNLLLNYGFILRLLMVMGTFSRTFSTKQKRVVDVSAAAQRSSAASAASAASSALFPLAAQSSGRETLPPRRPFSSAQGQQVQGAGRRGYGEILYRYNLSICFAAFPVGGVGVPLDSAAGAGASAWAALAAC